MESSDSDSSSSSSSSSSEEEEDDDDELLLDDEEDDELQQTGVFEVLHRVCLPAGFESEGCLLKELAEGTISTNIHITRPWLSSPLRCTAH